MTAIPYDSAFDRAPKRQSWRLSVLQFIGLIEPERLPPLKRQAPPYLPKFGDVDAREKPKRQTEPIEPPPVDLSDYLLSLTGERRHRAMRLLRHGYRIGVDVVATQAAPLRMAA